MTAKTTSKKKPEKPPFLIDPKHLLLLEGINRYQLVDAINLTSRYYKPGMIKTVKARLKTLVDEGFIHAHKTSSAYCYTLARRGINYLRDRDYDVQTIRPYQEDQKAMNDLFLPHTLELNDFLIASDRFATSVTGYSLQDLIHERTLKRSPFSVHIERADRKETVTVIPDAWFTILVEQSGDPKTFAFWVELDRGTIEAKQFKRKILGIIELVDNGEYEKRFETKSLTVLFPTTKGEKRVSQMRTWTTNALAALKENKQKVYQDMFCFLAVPPHGLVYPDPKTLFLDPVWHLPSSDQKLSLLVE